MKRIALLTIAALLLNSPLAQAERLTMPVMALLSVDAELPANAKDALPILDVAPHAFDADVVHALLMPDCTQRVDDDDPVMGYDVQIGRSAAGEEYMLIELTYGRICYGSAFWRTRLQDVMQIGDPMNDTLNYYPQDREVPDFPRAEALAQAETLLAALGIEIGVHLLPNPRVLTIDTASYDVMLEDLSQADWQADISRRYLEPYDKGHDGYLILYDLALNGTCHVDGILNWPLTLFISRQGVEHLETGYIMDVARASEPTPLLTAEQALLAATPGMEKKIAENEYVAGTYIFGYGDPAPTTVERIRFGYRMNQDWKAARPVWEYTFLCGVRNYPLAQWNPDLTWQARTFDNHAFLSSIFIDAITGEYIETMQF